MQSVSMNLSIHDTLKSFEKVKRDQRVGVFFSFILKSPFVWFAKKYCAFLMRQSSLMAEQCLKMKGLERDICVEENDSFIDPNFRIRDTLESLKQSVQELRKDRATGDPVCGFYEQLGSGAPPNLQIAQATFFRVLAESYEAANQLQWAIAEHDADLAKIQEGFEASSREEVEAMFARIIAG